MNERYFAKSLLTWHRSHNSRELPWKGEQNPYKIWVSEIILQQTQAAQGQKYYTKFIQHFPDVYALAAAPDHQVYKVWEGLGYYSRCRNMIATARAVTEKYAGHFPEELSGLLQLKGIGPYTAAAIASFAFAKPHAVVDGNVKRVLARFFNIQLPVDQRAGQKLIEKLAQNLVDKKHPAEYNQAIMDFGATVCRPANPDCATCPLRLRCAALREGTVHLLPAKAAKIKVKERFFHYLVITDQDHLFIRHRTKKDIWQHLYDFPLIESNTLLTPDELKLHKAIQPFLAKGILRLEGLSTTFCQKLTHQKITARFIHFHLRRKMDHIMDAVPLPYNEIEHLAFPKIVSDYITGSNQIIKFDGAFLK